MARLGFCGLGQMGTPMAANLLTAGHEVAVWNRSADKARSLADAGARVERSPAGAGAGAEAVFTMLGTPEAVRAVVLGDEGIGPVLGPGATLIEMSTIGPGAVRDIAAGIPDHAEVLDAPVLGSVPQATDGSLKIFVGGSRGCYERNRPLLDVLGTPSYLGDLGAGAATKVVVNSALVALMTTFGEALVLADALHLDERAVLDALAESSLGATVRRKRDNVTSGRFPPNFKLSLASKDARLVADEAASAGVDLRLAHAARSWIDDADAAGLGELDYSAVTAYARGRDAEDTRAPPRPQS